MKAAVHTKYGPPQVVQVLEVPQPAPAANEVLIKLYASTVNRTDCGFRSANYFISRFWSGLFRPRQQTLGCEYAGVVEAVGNAVTHFVPGNRVFGYNDAKFGGHAEFLVVSEKDNLAIIPERLSFAEGAALTEGAHYALCNIRAAKVQPGIQVLVYGASGGIGTAAVQLLKHFGATVTAVCNTKNVELVRSLGADEVIDYQTQDFTQTTQRFEFIFDAVGKSSFGQCKPLLTNKGIYISTELGKGGANIFYALFTPMFKRKKVLFPLPTLNQDDIDFLKMLAENGEFRPVIDRSFTLDQIVQAYEYVETGQKTGNVNIKIRES